MRLIFNLLAAIVIAVSFAPVAFAGTSDEELMQQYDELVDKWVSDGLNGGAIHYQTRMWLYKNGIIKDIDQKSITGHDSLTKHIEQKNHQIPAELSKRDMSDELLIRQYDEIFDFLTSYGAEADYISKATGGWLFIVGLFGANANTAHHADLLKHIEQKLKK